MPETITVELDRDSFVMAGASIAVVVAILIGDLHDALWDARGLRRIFLDDDKMREIYAQFDVSRLKEFTNG